MGGSTFGVQGFPARKEGGPIPADEEEAARGEEKPVQAASKVAAPAGQSQAKVSGTPVIAPLNGTFYRSDAPGKPPMAADGASVKAGSPVCVVEAMKLFNPVKASASGKITFLAEHGRPVSKGQALAFIE